jgi:hypothetical protein
MGWMVVGQMGTVVKQKKCYLVNIAKNEYGPAVIEGERNELGILPYRREKKSTIWLNCISDFLPKAQTGDTVIAEGEFEYCHSKEYPFTLKIHHIGIIHKKGNDALANGLERQV